VDVVAISWSVSWVRSLDDWGVVGWGISWVGSLDDWSGQWCVVGWGIGWVGSLNDWGGEWSVIGGKWCVGVSWIRGSNFVGVGVAGGNWVSDGLHDWGVISRWGISQRCVVGRGVRSGVWSGIWSGVSAIGWDDWSNCAGSGNEC
jgi:hypothetical protein